MSEPKTIQDRLEAFASTLVRHGVPVPHSLYVARGMFWCIVDHCDRSYTDVLGSAADVDRILEWKKPPQVLAPAMHTAGIILQSKTEYYFPYAYELSRSSSQRQWRRANRRSYEAAVRRCMPLVNHMPSEQMDIEPQRDLFGEPVHDAQENKHKIGFTTVKKYFLSQWHTRYGKPYAFHSRDAKSISRLLQSDSIDELKKAIDRYLSSNDGFYAGHPLGKLVGSINRFRVDPVGRGATQHGIPYSRQDEDLPLA